MKTPFSYARCALAQEAVTTHARYEDYLRALAEAELLKREQQRLQRLIRNARFPIPKDLADFDFGTMPSLNKQQILDLAQGRYIAAAETILLIGNPGLGKRTLRAVWRWRRVNRATGRGFTRPRPW